MIVDHTGLSASYFHLVTGRATWVVSAAEGFFVVSGLTLGMVVARQTASEAAARVVRRTGQIWLGMVGLTVGLAVAGLVGLVVWGGVDEVADAGRTGWLLDVLGMRTTFWGTDILVTYVLFLAAALPIVVLLHRGRVLLVIALLAGVYALSLVRPDAVWLPFASFRDVASNSPLFLGALLLGFHHRRVSAWWRSRRWSRSLDAVTVVAAVSLGTLHTLGYPGLPLMAAWLGGDDPLAARETQLQPVALLAVALMIRGFWIVVTWAWPVVDRTVRRPLAFLGQASLITLGAHLFALALLFSTPGFSEEAGRLEATGWVAWCLLLTVVPVVIIRRVQRVVASRGGPVRRAGGWVPALLVGGVTTAFLVLPG